MDFEEVNRYLIGKIWFGSPRDVSDLSHAADNNPAGTGAR
jgi:hypothetical protein